MFNQELVAYCYTFRSIVSSQQLGDDPLALRRFIVDDMLNKIHLYKNSPYQSFVLALERHGFVRDNEAFVDTTPNTPLHIKTFMQHLEWAVVLHDFHKDLRRDKSFNDKMDELAAGSV